MCSVFHFSIRNWLHGQVAAELQVWNAIVSFNEVLQRGRREQLGGHSEEEGACFQFLMGSSTYKMQLQMSNNRNRVYFLYFGIWGIVGVKGFRGLRVSWQSFSGQQRFGRHLVFLALIALCGILQRKRSQIELRSYCGLKRFFRGVFGISAF